MILGWPQEDEWEKGETQGPSRGNAYPTGERSLHLISAETMWGVCVCLQGFVAVIGDTFRG